MGKNTRVVFWSWLNRWGRRDADWIRRRFDLWKASALRSVLAQTKTDWRYALICGPLHKTFTSKLRSEIGDHRVALVHAGAEERRWRARLPSARMYVHARLDSDDLYHPRAAADLVKYARKKGRWLRFGMGYAWHPESGRLFNWRQARSPFYAHVEEGNRFRRAPSVPRPRHNEQCTAAATRLPPGRFLVQLHDLNTTTGLQSGPVGTEINGQRRTDVLRSFGIG